MIGEQHYTERAFAFLDILGFQEIVKDLAVDPNLFVKIKEALDFALRAEEIQNKKIYGLRLSKLEVIAFSDCIMISAPEAELFSVVLQAKMVAGNLLAMGFLCRGGITLGKGYHQGRIVFGQGFNDAYELERSVAVYPRIVVSEGAATVLRIRSATQKIKVQLLKQDVDGCWIIDIFSPPYPARVRYEEVRFLQAAREAIIKGIQHNQPGIRAKYRWLTFVTGEREELRGIINSGHSKTSAFVIRTVGDNHDPQHFSTWCAKCMAGIGNLPDTVKDRSIIIILRRKLPECRATGIAIC